MVIFHVGLLFLNCWPFLSRGLKSQGNLWIQMNSHFLFLNEHFLFLTNQTVAFGNPPLRGILKTGTIEPTFTPCDISTSRVIYLLHICFYNLQIFIIVAKCTYLPTSIHSFMSQFIRTPWGTEHGGKNCLKMIVPINVLLTRY